MDSSSSHHQSSSSSAPSATFVRHSGNPFIENGGGGGGGGSAGSSPFGSSSSCPSTPTVVVVNNGSEVGVGGNLQQQQSSSSAVDQRQNAPMPPYRIRRMRPEDVPAVLDIWAANDLHEGLHTIQSFMAVDRDGFVVAVEVEEDEEEGEEAAKDEAPKEGSGGGGGDQEAAAAADTTSKEVAITEEVTTTTSSTTSKPSSVGGKLMSGLLNRKQICCCAVQAPNSPPPPPEETASELQQQQQRQQKVTFRTSRSADSEETALVCRRREKRVLGMCAAVFVHPTAPAGFIGLYGVRPELHGRGIGQAMWRRVMEHVAGRNAALYAVPQHLVMYRDRAGFRHPDDRLLLIYESSEVLEPRVDLLVDGIRGVEVVTMAGQGSTAEGHPLQGTLQEITTEVLLEQVARFDAAVHGYPRRALLEKVLFEGESAALVALDLEEPDDQAGTAYSVLGYGCLRTNNIGKAMLGPLYADNDAVAELLMRRLFSALPGPFSRGLLYMSLDSNPGGERIADKLGLVQHEQLPRFFTGQPYREGAKWEAVYCIHSPNFSLL